MAHLFLALLLVLASGCADPPSGPWDDTLTLDAGLSAEKIEGALRAADAWHDRTGGRVALTIVLADTGGGSRTITDADLPARVVGRCQNRRLYFDDREMTEDYAYRVMLHEIGHYLYLDHEPDPGYVMSPGLSQAQTVDDRALAAFNRVWAEWM
jgi:hypothetical protein